MDSKALAKSKRTHSLHNKKKHQPHHGVKVASSVDDKKPAGKQAKGGTEKPHVQQTKEKTPQQRGSRALPSNWDRYDEDIGLASEGGALASSSQPTESFVPRSKGSDYAHLISEAKAQSQLHYSSDVLPLFDDFVRDFTQDFGPMLAAKGQSMLSWITDDSFEFEGKASISPEAPFLSLNLDALAKQIAKAKLSERLYLQSDLIPLELLDEASDEDKHDPQTHTFPAETNTLSSSPSNDHAVTATGDRLVQTAHEESNPPRKTPLEIYRSISPNPVPVPDHSTNPSPAFEAASAEAELDMLLNSFSDSTTPEPLGASLAGISSSTTGVSGEPTMKVNPTNIDDAIDILLEETSSLAIVGQRIPSSSSETATESISSNNNPVPKSKILDDFDSWLDTI